MPMAKARVETMRSKQIAESTRSIILSLVSVSFVIGCSGNSVGNSDIYAQLLSIMDDRKRLWFDPGPEGTREFDVSTIVCPIVSEELLTTMQDQIGASGDVEHLEFAEVNGSYAAGTKLWSIKTPVGNGDTAFLDITITRDATCRARYQHLR